MGKMICDRERKTLNVVTVVDFASLVSLLRFTSCASVILRCRFFFVNKNNKSVRFFFCCKRHTFCQIHCFTFFRWYHVFHLTCVCSAFTTIYLCYRLTEQPNQIESMSGKWKWETNLFLKNKTYLCTRIHEIWNTESWKNAKEEWCRSNTRITTFPLFQFYCFWSSFKSFFTFFFTSYG